MTIQQWLLEAAQQFKAVGIISARLDAEVLLSDEVRQSRAWILAHVEQTLPETVKKRLETHKNRRLKREPLAYIRGRQEFFGRTLQVKPAVLIPRPETETIIELLANLPRKKDDKLLDVGTGSGAIAITAALEFPELAVFATDISPDSLAIARQNAHLLAAEVTFYQQDLLEHEKHGPFDFIAANLPYVDSKWQRSAETTFEPKLALFAPQHGLALINQLLAQAAKQLVSKGFIFIEADPRQHAKITAFAQTKGYKPVKQQQFILVFQWG